MPGLLDPRYWADGAASQLAGFNRGLLNTADTLIGNPLAGLLNTATDSNIQRGPMLRMAQEYGIAQGTGGAGEMLGNTVSGMIPIAGDIAGAKGDFDSYMAGKMPGWAVPLALAGLLPLVPPAARYIKDKLPHGIPPSPVAGGPASQRGMIGDISHNDYQVPLPELGADGMPVVMPGRVPQIRQLGVKEAAKTDPSDPLMVEFDDWLKTPGAAEAAQRVAADPTVNTGRSRQPGAVLNKAADQFASNAAFLHRAEDPAQVALGAQWYPGANRVAQGLSNKYGMPIENSSFGIASLSPQKEWNLNVDAAMRQAYITNKMADMRMTPDMKQYIDSASAPPSVRARKQAIWDKKLNEIEDPNDRAAFMLAMDRAHFPETFAARDLKGDVIGPMRTNEGATQSYVPNTLPQIANSHAAFTAADFDVAQGALGNYPKVRSFGGNIVDPSDPRMATIDTHAVAANMLQPMGGKAPQVLQAFGNGYTPNAAAKAGLRHEPWMSPITTTDSRGYSGTQPLHQEALTRAASEFGILPRAEQSIVWDYGRRTMDGKKTDKNKALARAIWEEHVKGKRSLESAQNAVLSLFRE